MSQTFTIMEKGEIFTGEGKASEFLSLEPYTDFIEEKTGFNPYPGTLNLRMNEEEARKIKERATEHRMDPLNHEGRELGGLTLYEAEINGEECSIVQPDLTRYGEEVLEIVARDNLRKKFNLEDGDLVKIEAKKR